MSGLVLAIDAATYEGTAAVLREGAVVGEAAAAMRGETEERLMPAVLEALRASGASPRDVRTVICGEGPGSFTSLRIAGAIAKGIAFGNGVVLYGVSSLALVVAGPADLPPGDYLAVLDAMRGERFVAGFRRTAAGSVLPLQATRRVGAGDVATEAARAGAVAVGPHESQQAAPHARGVARMLDAILAAGPVALDTWEPSYGRLAEAQARWEAAHGRPLPT